MSIDEAIAKQRNIAEAQRLLYEACILKEQNAHFLRQAEEHEQLAEWLEELKAYRECNVCEYNKALDDFADKFISLCDDGEFMSRLNEFPATTTLEIAEQLKVGVSNE